MAQTGVVLLLALLCLSELVQVLAQGSSRSGGSSSSRSSSSSYRSRTSRSGSGGSCDSTCGIIVGVMFGIGGLVCCCLVCIRVVFGKTAQAHVYASDNVEDSFQRMVAHVKEGGESDVGIPFPTGRVTVHGWYQGSGVNKNKENVKFDGFADPRENYVGLDASGQDKWGGFTVKLAAGIRNNKVACSKAYHGGNIIEYKGTLRPLEGRGNSALWTGRWFLVGQNESGWYEFQLDGNEEMVPKECMVTINTNANTNNTNQGTGAGGATMASAPPMYTAVSPTPSAPSAPVELSFQQREEQKLEAELAAMSSNNTSNENEFNGLASPSRISVVSATHVSIPIASQATTQQGVHMANMHAVEGQHKHSISEQNPVRIQAHFGAE